MGVFTNMRDLQKQAHEIEKSMRPVAHRIRMAQEQMASATQLMAAQTQAANAAAAAAAGLANGTSVRRTVVINHMRQVGTINCDLQMQFDLTVMPDGLPPYPATIQQSISRLQAGQLRNGLSVPAAVDRSNPWVIWLDLSRIA
jgi:hypothetical protein